MAMIQVYMTLEDWNHYCAGVGVEVFNRDFGDSDKLLVMVNGKDIVGIVWENGVIRLQVKKEW